MSDMVTVSRVRLDREEENELLRRWCNDCAGMGGWFGIETRLTDDGWFNEYTIRWPCISV